jgi:ABC-type transporter Mla subunit MlaD
MDENVFRGVVAAAVVLAAIAFIIQAVAVLILYRAFRDVQGRVNALAERAEPILDSARRLVEETRPKFQRISTDLAEITQASRVELAKLAETVGEISERARRKAASVDAALEGAAENLQHAATSVRGAAVRPFREATAVAAGFRVFLITLLHGPQGRVDRVTQDEEMFI